jgi:uncharacterized protein DUF6526
VDPQSYANHRYRPRLWLIAALSAVLGFVLIVLSVLRQRSVGTLALLLMAFSLVCVVWMVRQYAVRLQDRIIRLEMQTRLARLGRASDMNRMTLGQIVALRFASDAELPALLDRAAAENLTADQIKRAVTAWQADHLRT